MGVEKTLTPVFVII